MQKYNPEIHHRKSMRCKGYDYSAAGYYFVTVCVQNYDCLFGIIADGKIQLNKFGKIVQTEWLKTGEIRKNVELDEYVVMPNHFHGILIITHDTPDVGATGPVAPTSVTLQPNSLGSIIGQFKSVVTKQIRKMGFANLTENLIYLKHCVNLLSNSVNEKICLQERTF